MSKRTSLRCFSFLMCIAFAYVGASGFAQSAKSNYPKKPITVIIPFAAGGSSDQYMRPYTETAKKFTKTPFVIVNKAGAGGAIGTTEIKSSQPDGYTIGFVTTGVLCTQPNIVKVNYDMAKDFEYINGVSFLPVAIAVKASSAYKNLDDLVSAAKKKTLTWSNAGVGTVPHLAGEIFMKSKGIKANLMPTTSGGSEAIIYLLGGNVDFVVCHVVEGISNPDVKFISIFANERDSMIPNAPTMKELGYKDMVLGVAKGFIAPKGTPKEALAFIDDITKKVMAEPGFIELAAKLSLGTQYESGEAFKQRNLADYVAYKAVVDSLGLAKK